MNLVDRYINKKQSTIIGVDIGMIDGSTISFSNGSVITALGDRDVMSSGTTILNGHTYARGISNDSFVTTDENGRLVPTDDARDAVGMTVPFTGGNDEVSFMDTRILPMSDFHIGEATTLVNTGRLAVPADTMEMWNTATAIIRAPIIGSCTIRLPDGSIIQGEIEINY